MGPLLHAMCFMVQKADFSINTVISPLIPLSCHFFSPKWVFHFCNMSVGLLVSQWHFHFSSWMLLWLWHLEMLFYPKTTIGQSITHNGINIKMVIILSILLFYQLYQLEVIQSFFWGQISNTKTNLVPNFKRGMSLFWRPCGTLGRGMVQHSPNRKGFWRQHE